MQPIPAPARGRPVIQPKAMRVVPRAANPMGNAALSRISASFPRDRPPSCYSLVGIGYREKFVEATLCFCMRSSWPSLPLLTDCQIPRPSMLKSTLEPSALSGLSIGVAGARPPATLGPRADKALASKAAKGLTACLVVARRHAHHAVLFHVADETTFRCG